MTYKPKIVLFLKRQSLSVLTEGRKLESIDITEDVYSDLEVVNHGNFVERVSELLKKLKIRKTEAALVFAKETVFEKYIQTTESDTSEIEKEFFASVPFEERVLAKKVIKDPKGVRLIAVNGDLIRTFVLALVPLKVHLSVAVPATLYEISGGGNSLSVADGLMILNKHEVMEKGNFLEVKKEIKKTSEDTDFEDLEEDREKPRFNQKILLVLGVSLIVGAIAITLMALGIVKNPFVKDVKKTSTTVGVGVGKKPAVSPSSMPKTESKESSSSSKEATKEASNEAILIP